MKKLLIGLVFVLCVGRICYGQVYDINWAKVGAYGKVVGISDVNGSTFIDMKPIRADERVVGKGIWVFFIVCTVLFFILLGLVVLAVLFFFVFCKYPDIFARELSEGVLSGGG